MRKEPSELRRRPVPKVDGSLPRRGEAPDLDELALPGVLVYRTLVLRRSPVASRPPAPYELHWQGRWYEVWQRPAAAMSVVAHLPLGDARSPAGAAGCVDVRRIAKGARTTAAVARAGPVAVLPARASGVEEAFVVPKTGRYSLWLAGSRRARADVFMDGQRIASAPAHFDHSTEYTELASAILGPGVHTVRVEFERRWLEPGAGGPEYGFGPARGHRREPAAERDHGRIEAKPRSCAAGRSTGSRRSAEREGSVAERRSTRRRTTIRAMSQPDDVTGRRRSGSRPEPRPPRAAIRLVHARLGVVAVVAVGIVAGLPRVVLHRSFERRRDECGSHRAVDGGARDRLPRRPDCAR